MSVQKDMAQENNSPQNTAPHRISRQPASPANVGRITAAAVHFQEPVSFRMVSMVVEQGQWNRVNHSTQSTVTPVQ